MAKITAYYAAANGCALESEFANSLFKLLHRQIWKLHGQRSKAGKSIGFPRAQLGQTFVVDAADGFCCIAVLSIPKRVDAEHLHVNAHAVHGGQA